ncbi:RNA-dependent RNA polymerase [Macrophomina phaseolina hypovirus 2]|uniref:RNA-dependent RNA polymerase n=1 Tax=Macrophomina phaseolina hypovirus 2 TaxID=2741642 RepID=A0A7U3W8K4_9VIRU|nr:RNA-dependent RNA polymerase [Macrophomina phaseolina hypovirus 2]QOE55583.1 RNA-dependent RNA polymerase [Macrophomina phaseolina hypovirus 2]
MSSSRALASQGGKNLAGGVRVPKRRSAILPPGFSSIEEWTKHRVQRYLDFKSRLETKGLRAQNPRAVRAKKARPSPRRVISKVRRPLPAWRCKPSMASVPWQTEPARCWDVSPSKLPAWSRPNKEVVREPQGMAVTWPSVDSTRAQVSEDPATKTGYWWWPKREVTLESTFTHVFDDGEVMEFKRSYTATGMVSKARETPAAYRARKAASRVSSYLDVNAKRVKTNWSWLVQRYERRAKFYADAEREIRITRNMYRQYDDTLGRVIRVDDNQFDGLSEVADDFEGPTSFFEGATLPLRKTRKAIKSEQHRLWQESRISAKYNQVVKSTLVTPPKVKRFPETTTGLRNLLTKEIGSLECVSIPVFMSVAKQLTEARRCPKNGFIVNLRGSVVTISTEIGSHGISFRLNGMEFLHAADESTPSCAESVMEVISRRNSSAVSTQFFEQQQWLIDLTRDRGQSNDLTAEEFTKRLGFPRRFDMLRLTPAILFGLALAYKKQWGCPKDKHCVVNFRRLEREITFKSYDTETYGAPGLYWQLDGKDYFHCGTPQGKVQISSDLTRERVRSRYWRLAAKYLLAGKTTKEAVIKGSVTYGHIECTEPGFLHRYMGFRVSAHLGPHRVFGRGLDYSQQNEDGSYTTIRQGRKRFWQRSSTLVFTAKGLAKLFWSKRSDEFWQWIIAKNIGMSLGAAELFFSQFIGNQVGPDLVPAKYDATPYESRIDIKSRTEYVEFVSSRDVHSGEVDESTQTKIPPAPPLPSHQKLVSLADGHSWLTAPGDQGKANRAAFRQTFPDDWQNRIHDEALVLMNHDVINYGMPARQQTELLCDPKQKFDLYAIKTPPRVKLPDTRPDATSELLRSIRDKSWILKRVTGQQSQSGEEPEVDTKPITQVSPPKTSRPRVKLPSGLLQDHFKRARNASDADIEENPGPAKGLGLRLPLLLTPDSPAARQAGFDQETMFTIEELFTRRSAEPQREEARLELLSEWRSHATDFSSIVKYRQSNYMMPSAMEEPHVRPMPIPETMRPLVTTVSEATVLCDSVTQESINAMDKAKVCKDLGEHIVTRLASLINKYSFKPMIDDLLVIASTWKSVVGCPASAQVFVHANTDLNEWTIAAMDGGSFGQIAWFLDGRLICHCADVRHGRSLSVTDEPLQRGRSMERALAHFKDVPKGTRFVEIVEGKDGTESLYRGRPAFKWLAQLAGQAATSVETAMSWFKSQCPMWSSNENVHIYRDDIPTTLSYLMDVAIRADPKLRGAQYHLDKIKDWASLKTDSREIVDIMNTLEAAITNSKVGIETCSVLAFAHAWKARWGCPARYVICVSANSMTRTWRLHVFNPREPIVGGGRMCFFLNDEYICHAGSFFGDSVTRNLQRQPSPYEPMTELPRQDASFTFWRQTSLRHPGQNPGLRHIKNLGMHGLPDDVIDKANSYVNDITSKAIKDVQILADTIRSWVNKHNHKEYVVTATCSHIFERPTVNLLPSNYFHVDWSEDLLEIKTGMNCAAVRNLRMIPCLYNTGGEIAHIANGRREDWYTIPKGESGGPVPLPKSIIHYITPAACGNMYVKPGYLGTEWLNAFINTLTVYGADEALTAKAEMNVVLVTPPTFNLGRPWFVLPESQKTTVNLRFWNREGNLLHQTSQYDSQTADQVNRLWYPGVPSIRPDSLNNVIVQYVCWDDVFKSDLFKEYQDDWKQRALAWHEQKLERGLVKDRKQDSINFMTQQGVHGAVSYGAPGAGMHTLTHRMTSNMNIDSHKKDRSESLSEYYYDEYKGEIVVHCRKCETPTFACVCDLESIFYKIFFWIWLLILWLRALGSPSLRGRSSQFTDGDTEYPPNGGMPVDYDQTLLITTMGTHGDTQPMMYYGNLAASVGVKTHLCKIHLADTRQLENLKNGKMYDLIPGFLGVSYGGQLGYRRVFQPHAEVSGKGSTYKLAPPDRYIHPIRYAENENKLNLFDKYITKLTELVGDCFSADFYIGALRGCHLPRSIDGMTLLERRTNRGLYEEGWCSGSADAYVIPEEIRKRCPRIPSGNHAEIFRDYKVIHMHGGAGTVQTALACGATPVVHDKCLDRNYKVELEPSMIKQPSVYPFYGWLILSGYKTQLPFIVRALSVFLYLWQQKMAILAWLGWNLTKVLAIMIAVYQERMWLFCCMATVPVIIWKMAWKVGLKRVMTYIVGLLWKYPFLVCLGRKESLLLFPLYGFPWFTNFLQDVNAIFKRDCELLFEPVRRGGTKFPFPLGHYAIRDMKSGEIYEGRFVTNRVTFGAPFKFVKCHRPMKPGAMTFPCPVNLCHVRGMIQRAEAKPYGPHHNCTSMVFQAVAPRGLFCTILMAMISTILAIAFHPPEWVRQFLIWLKQGRIVEDSFIYEALGFAAGDSPTRMEIEPLVETPEPDYSGLRDLFHQESPQMEPSYDGVKQLFEPSSHPANLENSAQWLMDEIAVMGATIMAAFGDEQGATVEQAMAQTFARHLEKDVPNDLMVTIEPVPPYVQSTWAEIVEGIHSALKPLHENRITHMFIAWLKEIKDNVNEFLQPLYKMCWWFLEQAKRISKEIWSDLWKAICKLLDHVWGPVDAKRVKTVWGLTGLAPNSVISKKAQLAEAIIRMEYTGRSKFMNDWDDFIERCKKWGEASGAKGIDNIGGSQRRKVTLPSNPTMSQLEAQLLGVTEFNNPEDYESRIRKITDSGVPQGADGVFYAALNTDRIAASIGRYEEDRPVVSTRDRQRAAEIAEAMCEHNPEVFLDCDIMPLEGVIRYIKQKYSPGAPFLNPKSFKSRQAMFEAGWDKAMINQAKSMLTQTGKYPTQFYHAFVKSQVVDISKCLPEEVTGKVPKDVRTVVSQDLWSYFLDQCVQIERNKRNTWMTHGAGSGMPLNQSMAFIYETMAELQRARGGCYVMADAKAFDSSIGPFGFEVAAELARRGFKNHPSGNGDAIASVLTAKYKSMQDSYVLGITEPMKDVLTIGADEKVWQYLKEVRPKGLMFLDELLPNLHQLSSDKERQKAVSELQVPGASIVVTTDRLLVPKMSNWMGEFTVAPYDPQKGNPHQRFHYSQRQWKALLKDVKNLRDYNRQIVSNVHFKNKGGGTGQSATTWDNTAIYKGILINAWMDVTGRSAREFYDYNIMFNTSDDLIWQSGGKWGLKTQEQFEAFKDAVEAQGVILTIDWTKNINKVEYLSKFVRTPTSEDSRTHHYWRSWRIADLARTGKIDPNNPRDTERFSLPQFIVNQNPAAIEMRRTAFRYYQSSAGKYLYTMIERGAGHAQVCAFSPELYSRFANEWVADVNTLLKRENILQEYKIVNDKYGLPQVLQVNVRWKTQALSPRQTAVLAWLKGAMFPSYMKVIDTHMNVKKPDPLAHEKFLRKLQKGYRGWDEVLREGVDGLYAFTNAIPDSWSKKFQTGPQVLYPENPFPTLNMWTERFVMSKLLEEKPEDEIDFQMFSMKIQESPYGTGCDPYRFWEKWQEADWRTEFMETDPRFYQAMVMMISTFYAMTHYVELWIYTLPLIGALYHLLMWTFIGSNKLYGICNTMYWHSRGSSSRIISQLQPKDPYMLSKRFCIFLVDFIPMWVGTLLFIPGSILDLLAEPLEIAARVWNEGLKLKAVVEGPKGTAATTIDNPWTKYSVDYVEAVRASPTKRLYVDAPTGTGKSTWNVAALWQMRAVTGIRKIWILTPRKMLRDDLELPFGIEVQKLYRHVKLKESADIHVCTYGHFLNRMSEVDPDKDLALFDEFHEATGEMILAEARYEGPAFLMSATPLHLDKLKGTPTKKPDISRRHRIVVHEMEGTSPIDMFIQANNRYPDLCKRAMIIVPSYKAVEETIAQLDYLGYKANELSGRKRKVPKQGIIVATPYVQTGADIKPPVELLVDCGKDIVIDEGKFIYPYPWTDPDVNKQREGRVGRLKDGVVFRPPQAGTGKRPKSYPAGHLFAHKSVAEYFGVKQLTPLRNPLCASAPFMAVNKSVLPEARIQRSVLTIHLLALSGTRAKDLHSWYTRVRQGHRLGEDFWWVESALDNKRTPQGPLIAWDEVQYWVNTPNAIIYGIQGKATSKKPIWPVRGNWLEDDVEIIDEPDGPGVISKRVKELVQTKAKTIQELTTQLNSWLAQCEPTNPAVQRSQHYVNLIGESLRR